MTKDELLAILKRCNERGAGKDDYVDAEQAHVDADQALLDYINDPDITAAFKAVHKWYA